MTCVNCAGLKAATTTVNDYNQLMKDFPLNDLLSATKLNRIRVALQAIFLHLLQDTMGTSSLLG